MTVQVVNFGCRLNSYESEVIKDHLHQTGQNNVVVFNSCAVTAEAERQLRQAIRKYRRENPDITVLVTGCAAQIDPARYAEMPEVNYVIGNQEKLEKSTYHFLKQEPHTRVLVNDIMSVKETAFHLIHGYEARSRAFVQVQNGCNHRCTFCIIPYGRGNSRSVAIGEVVNQVRKLVENGYQEIVLTGVDITDYGKDLPGAPSLGNMIKRLFNLVPDIKRLRLSSIDVAEIDKDMMDLIADEPRFMPHLHLSLQSGDNLILKRMKRRHTREDILSFYKRTKSLRPDIVFGADIIAGFPTESEEAFQNSVRIIQEAELVWLHIFPFSARSKTPAAKIPSQISIQVRKKRAEILRAEGKKNLSQFLHSRIGKTESVIIEKSGVGRTEHFAEIHCDPALPIAQIVKLRVDKVKNERLYAT